MAGIYEENNDSEIEQLERNIRNCEGKIAAKKAYLDFLTANPLFVEYEKLRRAAN